MLRGLGSCIMEGGHKVGPFERLAELRSRDKKNRKVWEGGERNGQRQKQQLVRRPFLGRRWHNAPVFLLSLLTSSEAFSFMWLCAWPCNRENHQTCYAWTLHELPIWDTHSGDKSMALWWEETTEQALKQPSMRLEAVCLPAGVVTWEYLGLISSVSF